MKKQTIIILIIAIVVFITLAIGIILINRNNTEEFDVQVKKQLANNVEENENIEVVTTIANQNVVSPNDIKEEYILRENNGYIAIYKVDENGKEILIKTTEIVVAYLPDIDKIELSKGIRVFGKEKLNLRIEDYE